MSAEALAGYNRIWRLLRPLVWLYLQFRVWRGREDKTRLSERYGNARIARPKGVLFWLHAVSVGESVAALNLANSLRERRVDATILITTNTATAAARIAEQKDLHILHAYQPLDHPDWVDKFLRHWQPDYAVMLESDFWPNLISCTAAKNIPLCFASAQLSDKAFQAWQNRSALAHIVFSAPQDIFAVDQSQADKFRQLAGNSGNKPALHIGGSLKINPASLTPDKELIAMLRQAAENRPILVAASTHKGEEEIILAASQRVRQNGRPHFLVIAPRHPERGQEVARLVGGAGQRQRNMPPRPQDDIYICDSLGEMGSLYTAADIIILGGTFSDLGGHNPLEIALFETPILAGTSRFKNKAIFEALAQAGLIEETADRDLLASALEKKLEELQHNRPLMTDKNRKQIADIVRRACGQAANTADYLLHNMAVAKSGQNKISNP